MRNRKDVEKAFDEIRSASPELYATKLMLEALLDIRELLVEIDKTTDQIGNDVVGISLR